MSGLSLMDRALLANRRAEKALRCTVRSAFAAADGKRVGIVGANPEETERAVKRAREMAVLLGADPSLILPARVRGGGGR